MRLVLDDVREGLLTSQRVLTSTWHSVLRKQAETYLRMHPEMKVRRRPHWRLHPHLLCLYGGQGEHRPEAEGATMGGFVSRGRRPAFPRFQRTNENRVKSPLNLTHPTVACVVHTRVHTLCYVRTNHSGGAISRRGGDTLGWTGTGMMWVARSQVLAPMAAASALLGLVMLCILRAGTRLPPPADKDEDSKGLSTPKAAATVFNSIFRRQTRSNSVLKGEKGI